MISSNPYHPLRLQRELLTQGWGSHGWLMERRRWWWWWRSPPNPRPDRVPERSFSFRIAVSDGGGAAEVYLEKNAEPPLLSGQRVYVGGRRARPGLGRAPWWWGQATAPPSSLLLAPWVFWQNRIFAVFSGIFPESRISAQKRDTRAILLKTALVRVSCIQNTQIRGETIAKVFGKVDTFWTYQCVWRFFLSLSASASGLSLLFLSASSMRLMPMNFSWGVISRAGLWALYIGF
jgi:hypothetical protein